MKSKVCKLPEEWEIAYYELPIFFVFVLVFVFVFVFFLSSPFLKLLNIIMVRYLFLNYGASLQQW